jgi:hypothetical protein
LAEKVFFPWKYITFSLSSNTLCLILQRWSFANFSYPVLPFGIHFQVPLNHNFGTPILILSISNEGNSRNGWYTVNYITMSSPTWCYRWLLIHWSQIKPEYANEWSPLHEREHYMDSESKLESMFVSGLLPICSYFLLFTNVVVRTGIRFTVFVRGTQ